MVTGTAELLRSISTHSPAFTVERYSLALKREWDSFISKAAGATFLFHRDYMEYHADRFSDHSLMIYRGPELMAVLPANLNARGDLISHEGLTYGGLVTTGQATLSQVLACFHSLLCHLDEHKLPLLRYKRMPNHYRTRPDDDVAYCLFLLESRLYRRECSLVIPLAYPLPLQKRRQRQVKKAIRAGLSIREESHFVPFWEAVLTPRLSKRYGVKPVHTAGEITLLASRFPDNIKQFSVYDGPKIMAGITIYETPTVAHAQYIATTDQGRKIGALDYLIHWLMNDRYRAKQFFDFGGSNEQEGRALNHGLLEWKESFGARCRAQDFYEIPTCNYFKLEPVLAGSLSIPHRKAIERSSGVDSIAA